MANVPLCFLDTETDGLRVDRRPWEIAMIRREPDGTETRALIQVAGIDLSNAEPMGLKISGFYERYFRYVIPGSDTQVIGEGEAAHDVERMTMGAHLVGAVPGFDAETLAAMLRRHKLAPAWHYHLIDVEVLAAGWLAAHNLLGWTIADNEGLLDKPEDHDVSLPWKSDDLSRACGVEPPSESERHTAMGDALWVMRWYDAIMGKTDG